MTTGTDVDLDFLARPRNEKRSSRFAFKCFSAANPSWLRMAVKLQPWTGPPPPPPILFIVLLKRPQGAFPTVLIPSALILPSSDDLRARATPEWCSDSHRETTTTPPQNPFVWITRRGLCGTSHKIDDLFILGCVFVRWFVSYFWRNKLENSFLMMHPNCPFAIPRRFFTRAILQLNNVYELSIFSLQTCFLYLTRLYVKQVIALYNKCCQTNEISLYKDEKNKLKILSFFYKVHVVGF